MAGALASERPEYVHRLRSRAPRKCRRSPWASASQQRGVLGVASARRQHVHHDHRDVVPRLAVAGCQRHLRSWAAPPLRRRLPCLRPRCLLRAVRGCRHW